MAYFSEKLSSSKENWTTYEQKMYAMVRAFKQWEHYLYHKPFVLWSDHQTLQYLKSQKTLNPMHARWIAFLGTFNYTFHHKLGSSNSVVDTLS